MSVHADGREGAKGLDGDGLSLAGRVSRLIAGVNAGSGGDICCVRKFDVFA